MSKKTDNEVVVKFQNSSRRITMYFTENGEGLDMQMSVEPEFTEDEEPDLCMLLASTLMNALQTENIEDDVNPKVYDGKD